MSFSNTSCAGVLFALGVLCAQEPVRLPAHLGFLPGEAEPVLITWNGGVFELRPVPRAGDPRPASLGGGALSDVASDARLEPVGPNACLLVARRPLSVGRHLQLGLLRRVDGVWRLAAAAVLDDVVAEGRRGAEAFDNSELVAWHEATKTATVVVQLEFAPPPDRAGEQQTWGALHECEVVLTEVTGAPNDAPVLRVPTFPVAAPPARLVATGTDVRTHRDGTTCLVTTRAFDSEDVVKNRGRPQWRLRAWLREDRGSWRALDVPRLLVEQNYGVLRRADGEIVVAMITKSGDQDVLRTARWSAGLPGRGFVVEDEVLTTPRPVDHAVAWHVAGPTPKPWTITDGVSAKRVQ